MKIRFQINAGDGAGILDYEHPVLPRRGDIVHLRDREHAFVVVLARHLVGGDLHGHVFLRDATSDDIEQAGG